MRTALDRLIALHRVSWPAGLAHATRDVDGQVPPLSGPEEAAIAGAVPLRRAEFAAGRAAARAALGRIGIPPLSIPMAADRSPSWPEGVVGSISHTAGTCVAIVARRTSAAGLGVDIEPLQVLAPDLIPRIADREEIAILRDLTPGLAALRIFSLKEAAYKAKYPLSRDAMDFEALRLTPTGLRMARDVWPFSAGELLPTQQWTGFGLCLSLCVLPWHRQGGVASGYPDTATV